MDVADPRDGSKATTMILMGAVNLTFTEPERRSSGFSFTLTGDAEPVCEGLPRPGLVIQSPDLTLTLISVNGVELAINGTVVLHPIENGVSVSSITHETILGQSGEVVFAGYGVDLTPDGEVTIAPYDPANVAHLPIEVLPTIERIPVPGSASSTEQLPLHLAPDYARVANNAYIDAGLPISVIGQNPAGDWLYVRTYDLITGWIPRGWVTLDTAGELPSFAAAPPLPTRPYGPVHAQGTTVAEGNNLRAGPGEDYEIIIRVPLRTAVDIYARSPDSLWYYVALADGTRGWLSVDIVHSPTLESIEELPFTPEYPGEITP
jgi:SH3-like domain-containing protein